MKQTIMQPDQLRGEYGADGYRLLYKGFVIGGAGSLRRSGRTRNGAMRANDLRMYRKMRDHALTALLNGYGEKRFYDEIARIDRGAKT